MEMSNLPLDLEEEILSKLPVTSLRAIRLACKKWNTLSKTPSFAKKHIGIEEDAAGESMVITVMDYKVYLMEFNLNGIQNNAEPFIKSKGKLISLDDSDRVSIFKVCHCNGLLLCVCVTKDENKRLVVWNPYSGQKRWIEHRSSYHILDHYAIGYEMKKNKSGHTLCHKILRYLDGYDGRLEYEIYHLESNSWRVLDITPQSCCIPYQNGMSVRGNTYWFGTDERRGVDGDDFYFLICFDFTSERFGPCLRFPFRSYRNGLDIVSLSTVGKEQLAVLFKPYISFEIKIWITSKINPNEVWWSKFLAVDMRPFTSYRLKYSITAVSFFIDEKKKLLVVFDRSNDENRLVAYIIGVDGYLRHFDLGEATNNISWPLMCSYVPSLVHIKQLVLGKRKHIID